MNSIKMRILIYFCVTFTIVSLILGIFIKLKINSTLRTQDEYLTQSLVSIDEENLKRFHNIFRLSLLSVANSINVVSKDICVSPNIIANIENYQPVALAAFLATFSEKIDFAVLFDFSNHHIASFPSAVNDDVDVKWIEDVFAHFEIGNGLQENFDREYDTDDAHTQGTLLSVLNNYDGDFIKAFNLTGKYDPQSNYLSITTKKIVNDDFGEPIAILVTGKILNGFTAPLEELYTATGLAYSIFNDEGPIVHKGFDVTAGQNGIIRDFQLNWGIINKIKEPRVPNITPLVFSGKKHLTLTSQLKTFKGGKTFFTCVAVEQQQLAKMKATFFESTYKTKNNLQINLFIFGVISLIIFILLSHFLSKKISSPLEEFTKRVKRISDGDFHERLILKQNDEIGVLSAALDKMVQEIETSQAKLKDHLERFKILTETIPFGISLLGRDNKYKYLNPGFVNIFGYTLDDIPNGEEWFKKAFSDFDYKEQVLVRWFKDREQFNTQNHLVREFKIICKDGRKKDILFNIIVLENKDTLTIFEDITERKKAISKLKESEERNRTLLEISPDPIVVYDSKGLVQYLNKAFEETFGWSSKELLNRRIDFVPPSEKGKTQAAIQKMLEDKSIILESQRVTKNGSLLHIQFKGTLIYNDKGIVEGSIVVARDITDLKRTESELKKANQELKETQTQLIQSAKLASIGELAAGVAHELNQPLMIMRMASQQSERSMKKNGLRTESIEELHDTVARNTKRMMKIIDHLNAFSRQSPGSHELVDINKIIEGAFLMVNEQLRLRNITVIRNFLDTLPKVKGDLNRIEQVLLNLITNARDALEDSTAKASDKKPLAGQIEITTRLANLKKDHIEILVKDNGSGIPESKRDKIFDPFFTTKAVGKGTGLGLSISYGIIKEHGGEIVLLTSGSEGTCFEITLPIQGQDNKP